MRVATLGAVLAAVVVRFVTVFVVVASGTTGSAATGVLSTAGAGSVATVGAGSLATGGVEVLGASCAKTGVDESARAAAIAGRALVRA